MTIEKHVYYFQLEVAIVCTIPENEKKLYIYNKFSKNKIGTDLFSDKIRQQLQKLGNQ